MLLIIIHYAHVLLLMSVDFDDDIALLLSVARLGLMRP